MTGRRASGGLTGQVREFFFADEAPYGLAIVRITLPLVLFYDLMRRWPYARELFSADGATSPLWINFGFANPFPELPGAAAVALFTLLLATCVASSVGWMTRTSLAVMSALYFYFTTMDSTSTITKYTVICCHVLPLLALSNCGAVWSLDSLRGAAGSPLGPAWPRRLIQILIGVVYFGAAFTKIHTPSYFNGDQMLYWMLTHVNGRHPGGEFLAYYPAALAAAAYVGIIWEILFPFLAWRGVARVAMLTMGVAFHLGTWAMLGLDIFPCVMFSVYFAFMSDRDAYRLGRWIGRAAGAVGLSMRELPSAWVPIRRFGPVAYVAVLWVLAVSGAAAERLYDPYRERGPNGPLALLEIEPAVAARMLGPSEPLRLKDQVFSFELGTGLFAEALVGRKKVFEKGETLVAQCLFAPPHADVYAECNLHSGDGRLMERSGIVVVRENHRHNFMFSICDAVPPGEYELVLKLAGNEITRRRFTVAGDGTQATAAREQSASIPPAIAN